MRTHQHHRHHRSWSDVSDSEITGWFAGAMPDDLYTGPPTFDMDGDEILVIGALARPEVAEGTDAAGVTAAERARIDRFREDTREQRIAVARQAEERFGRKVSWGATCGDTTVVFTNVAAPVGTRLRLAQRKVLDAVVASGVARNRAEALAWCVRLVEKNADEWLAQVAAAEDARRTAAESAPDVS